MQRIRRIWAGKFCPRTAYGFHSLNKLFFTSNATEFRFNFEGAVLGRLESLDSDDVVGLGEADSKDLPFTDFIATQLLPCGPIDQPVQKFTGNDDCGPAPREGDSLTAAIHAFTHYVAVFSRGNLVLCDLQGLQSTLSSN